MSATYAPVAPPVDIEELRAAARRDPGGSVKRMGRRGLIVFADGWWTPWPTWMSLSENHRTCHRVAARDGWTCVYCGDPVACICTPAGPDGRRNMATLDHQLARALGGNSHLRNLALACMPCNTRKGMRDAAVMFA